MTLHRALYLVVATVAVVLVAGCPPKLIVDTGPGTKNCSASDECPAGHICAAGQCTVGVCDPALESDCDGHTVADADKGFCCKPWEECNAVSFSCENDPAVHGIGCDPTDTTCTPCQTQDDCAAGQFCSGAACFDSAGRKSCTSSFECAGGQRCDRNVFLCVPDKGGCNFCGPDFPELCCESNQLCSQQSGFCNNIPDAQCSTPGSHTECAAGLQCTVDLLCVQCVSNTDCGPGLECDTGTGDCFPPGSSCTSDAECTGDLKCATATQECVSPTCTTDSECHDGGDARKKCDISTFTCFLPAPVCTESDEPNNSTDAATPMTNLAYSGLLCRADTDVLSFPVNPHKAYTATVDFGGGGEPGIAVQVLNTQFQIETAGVFGQNDGSIALVGVTGDSESGEFYVRIQGNNPDHDHWNYTVSVAESEPSPVADCSAGAQPEEPNDDFAHATPLVMGTTTDPPLSRCGTTDADFYSVDVSPLHGVKVTLAGFKNAEGNLNLTLFPTATASSALPGGTSTNDVEQVTGPEGPATYFIKVALASPNGAVVNQTYTISTEEVARPAACAEDPTENDGSIATAAVLPLVNDANGNPGYVLADDTNPDGSAATPGSVVGPLRCNPQDVDMFKFTMPPNLGGVVQLHFNHNEGDMALDLLDATTGTQLATSNVSSASNGTEQVSIPGNATDSVDYVAKARLATATGGIIAQHYSVKILTFDNGQCIASEPNGGDDIFGNGRCIGNFTPTGPACTNDATRIPEPMDPGGLAACSGAPDGTITGCGRICGNDDVDWYRVGPLSNDQVLHAHLDYDFTQGELALVRGTLSATGTVTEAVTTDSDHDGHIDLFFTAPTGTPKEYGIKVKAQGTTGHQVEQYAVKIEVGESCTDDDNDAGSSVSNEKPSESTIIRPDALPNDGFVFDSSTDDPTLSLCHSDVDVYELISFPNETITVTLTAADNSPSGMQAEIGTRPSPLTSPAVPITPNPVIAVTGAPASYDNTVTQQLYITVKAAAGQTVTGPYNLVVTATATN